MMSVFENQSDFNLYIKPHVYTNNGCSCNHLIYSHSVITRGICLWRKDSHSIPAHNGFAANVHTRQLKSKSGIYKNAHTVTTSNHRPHQKKRADIFNVLIKAALIDFLIWRHISGCLDLTVSKSEMKRLCTADKTALYRFVLLFK